MATVKSYDIAAYMSLMHAAIKAKAKDLIQEALVANPSPQLVSGFDQMRNKAGQKQVIDMAVLLAQIISKKQDNRDLNETERDIYGSGATTLDDAWKSVIRVVSSNVAYDNSIKATLSYLENTAAVSKATDDLTVKMKADLQTPNHWAVAVLDVLLVTGLQSVPIVGPILSSVVKGGIVSATSGVVGGMAANQTQALRSTDPNLLAEQKLVGGQNSLNVMAGGSSGFVVGQRTSGTYTDPKTGATVQIQNDLGAQAAQNLANQASSQFQATVNSSLYDKKEAEKDIRNYWYATGLNATFVYTMIVQARQRAEKEELTVLAKDEQFLSRFAAQPTNAWLVSSNNPQTTNQLVARFRNRGVASPSVEKAAQMVGKEFQETLSDKEATLKDFSKSIAKKLKEFRNLVEEFLSMSISLSFVDFIEEFKTAATGKSLNSTIFGDLTQTTGVGAHDERICALLILSYWMIKDLKHKTAVLEKWDRMRGSDPFLAAIRGQDAAVQARRRAREEAEALVAGRENSIQTQAQDTVRRLSALVSETAKTQGAAAAKALEQRLMPEVDAALQTLKDATLQAGRDLPGMQERRLKTYQVMNKNDPSAAVGKFKLSAIGLGADLSWSPIVSASENYVEQLKRATLQDIKAVFPNPKETGFEEALKAVLACTVIISQVHSQSARSEDIEISYGAVKALADLDFVLLYNKVLGKVWGSTKEEAFVSTTASGNTHRLRWPKEGKLNGDASIAETAAMYAFAATVVAYVDLAEVAMGRTTWKTYKSFLNNVIREIVIRGAQIRNTEAGTLKTEIKNAKAAAEANAADVKRRVEAAKKAEKDKKENDKNKNKQLTEAERKRLLGNLKL